MAKVSSMKAKPEAPQSTSECESSRREESSMVHLRIRCDPSKHSIEFPSSARPETRTTGRRSGAVGAGGRGGGGVVRRCGWGSWGGGGLVLVFVALVVWVALVVVAGTKVTGLWRGAGVRCARSVLLVAAEIVGLILGLGGDEGIVIDRKSWMSSSVVRMQWLR